MTNVVFLPDMGHGFVPERLVEARQARQMSCAELGRAVGLTGQAIGYYEDGERRPDMGKLLLIADALGRTPGFFLRPVRSVEGRAGTRFFRATGRRVNRVNLALDVRMKWLAELLSFITESVLLPKNNLPDISYSSPAGYSKLEVEIAAEQTRRFWGLSDGPIANMVALLETHGVIVTRFSLGSEQIDAFSCWQAGRPHIVLGSDKRSAARSRFDAAHELAHLLLHRGISQKDLEDKSVLDRIESEANTFAGAFLLPRRALLNEYYSTRLGHLEGLKARWRVSMQAIAHRCKQIGAMDEEQYVNFRKQMSARKWLTLEPLDEVLPLEQARLFLKAWEMASNTSAASGDGEVGFGADLLPELCSLDPEPPPPPVEPRLRRVS